MSELKNINTDSVFESRTGLIVWLKGKRNTKRLMNYGLLHYVSAKLDYALLYVDTKKLDQTIERLKKEQDVKSVEQSELKDLPITYDGVLEDMQKEIERRKEQEKIETFTETSTFDNYS